jgi:hypothetical protein
MAARSSQVPPFIFKKFEAAKAAQKELMVALTTTVHKEQL